MGSRSELLWVSQPSNGWSIHFHRDGCTHCVWIPVLDGWPWPICHHIPSFFWPWHKHTTVWSRCGNFHLHHILLLKIKDHPHPRSVSPWTMDSWLSRSFQSQWWLQRIYAAPSAALWFINGSYPQNELPWWVGIQPHKTLEFFFLTYCNHLQSMHKPSMHLFYMISHYVSMKSLLTGYIHI